MLNLPKNNIEHFIGDFKRWCSLNAESLPKPATDYALAALANLHLFCDEMDRQFPPSARDEAWGVWTWDLAANKEGQ